MEWAIAPRSGSSETPAPFMHGMSSPAQRELRERQASFMHGMGSPAQRELRNGEYEFEYSYSTTVLYICHMIQMDNDVI